MGRILYWQYLLISIFNRIIILNSNGLKIVILLQHPFQVRSLIEYLSCKLSVGYNLPVAVVLQGALTDVQQPAHIAVVQPVRMLTFLSECLVATLGKAQDFISKLCPIGFCNDVIVHNFILLLFVVSNLSSFHRQR